MRDMSKRGILFLVYSHTPTPILFNYTESVLVLSNKGRVLFNGKYGGD